MRASELVELLTHGPLIGLIMGRMAKPSEYAIPSSWNLLVGLKHEGSIENCLNIRFDKVEVYSSLSISQVRTLDGQYDF